MEGLAGLGASAKTESGVISWFHSLIARWKSRRERAELRAFWASLPASERRRLMELFGQQLTMRGETIQEPPKLTGGLQRRLPGVMTAKAGNA